MGKTWEGRRHAQVSQVSDGEGRLMRKHSDLPGHTSTSGKSGMSKG